MKTILNIKLKVDTVQQEYRSFTEKNNILLQEIADQLDMVENKIADKCLTCESNSTSSNGDNKFSKREKN